MRYPREEAIGRLEKNGFKLSRPTHGGQMYRNPDTLERAIVPNSPTIDERNFKDILKQATGSEEAAQKIIETLNQPGNGQPKKSSS